MFTTLTQVALGGAIGAALRYLSNVGAMRLFGPGFPYATLFVNILGSFAMGLLVVTLAKKGGTALAPFLMTGVLGGFTTFSAFSLESALLIERGLFTSAALYAAGSVFAGIAGLFIGLYITRAVA